MNRLKLISAQDALIFLKSSFSAPRVLHLLRCSPSIGPTALGTFDQLLRTEVSTLTNNDLSDSEWSQATLPVSDEGLGVIRVSMLALFAFLALAVSTLCLQDEILFDCQCRPDDPLVESYMSLWSASFGALPTGNASHKQAAWDRPGIVAIKDELMTTPADPRQKVVLLAAMAPHSGDWLSALPIASCGLRMDDESVRVGGFAFEIGRLPQGQGQDQGLGLQGQGQDHGLKAQGQGQDQGLDLQGQRQDQEPDQGFVITRTNSILNTRNFIVTYTFVTLQYVKTAVYY